MERFDLILGASDDMVAETNHRPFMFANQEALAPRMPRHDEVADPEAGWASRNPARAMAFLYVSPRDCGAVDELLAL